MFSKTTVSIYFTDYEIYIIEVDPGKQKILRYCSVRIPEALIRNGKVHDVGGLAKILKGLWSKFGFGQKEVGLLIPEFSTYTKLLTLPKLAVSDLDEAVRWQAQEFLPTTQEETVLDWQVISRNEKNIEVLVVAVAKEILSSFVEAAEKAGLFPMDVQIPSLSLGNLTKKYEGPLLVIHFLLTREYLLQLTVKGFWEPLF